MMPDRVFIRYVYIQRFTRLDIKQIIGHELSGKPVPSSETADNRGDYDLFEFTFIEIFLWVRLKKSMISYFHSSNSILTKDDPRTL